MQSKGNDVESLKKCHCPSRALVPGDPRMASTCGRPKTSGRKSPFTRLRPARMMPWKLNWKRWIASHRHLEHAVKFTKRRGLGHRKAASDHPDYQLQNQSGLRQSPRTRHAKCLQGAFPDSGRQLPHDAQVLGAPLITDRTKNPCSQAPSGSGTVRCLQANPSWGPTTTEGRLAATICFRALASSRRQCP